MKSEFIKKIEECMVDNCPNCNRCATMNSEKNRIHAADIRTSSELYNKEVEAYYFYFLENKAS